MNHHSDHTAVWMMNFCFLFPSANVEQFSELAKYFILKNVKRFGSYQENYYICAPAHTHVRDLHSDYKLEVWVVFRYIDASTDKPLICL